MSDEAPPKKMPWYEDGLRFHCTGCGKCCTGFPGAVWVSDQEVHNIASYLSISVEEAERTYMRRIGMTERRSLKEVGKEYDCIFLENKKLCRIYEVRPEQCRTFPWWPSVVESPESWEEARQFCEGIEHPDAPLTSADEIERLVDGKGS